ncbi:MAG TPA: PilT/PilU family type 4a pilus ATPase, partial [Myxococcaceae bacterium]
MPPSSKELVATFRTADLTAPRDLEAFVKDAGEPGLEVMVKLLEVLSARGAEKDFPKHRARCAAFDKLVTRAPDKALFLPMVQALKAGDPTLRTTLMALLPAVNQVTEHPQLCQLLRSNDASVRQVAAQVLGGIGGKTTLRLLGEWLAEPAFLGRIEALDALARCAGHHAIQAFRGALFAGNDEEQAHALKYLGDPKYVAKGTREALQIIVEFLEQGPGHRAPAIAAFCRICSEEDYFVAIAPCLDSDEVEVVRAAVEGLRGFRTPRTFEALERKLRAGPNAIRFVVLTTLEAIGSDEVTPLLVDAIGHRLQAIRNRASEVLSTLNRSGKIDLARTLIWLAHSKDVNVRRQAVELVRNTNDQGDQIWPKLLKLLRDEDWWVREGVAEAVVAMAGHKLTPHILPYLDDPSDVIRRFTIELLMRLDDPRSLTPLLKVAAKDPDWWARERAVEAIVKMKDPRAIPHLVALLGDRELLLRVLEGLGTLGARTAAREISALAGDGDADVRLAVAKCLAGFDEPSLGAPLEVMLGDEDARVREVARDATARWRSSAQAAGPRRGPRIGALLEEIGSSGADDLLIAVGHPPTMKKMGRAMPISDSPLTAEHTRELLGPVLKKEQLRELEERGDADFSYAFEGMRFRVNAYKAEGGLCAVFRIVRGKLLDFDSLGLPEVVRKFADLKNGLVVIGGPTGSGKSTTLAALIDHITRHRSQHIVTLEDPVEVVYNARKCLVNQREMGSHAVSFAAGLRGALRQDPNVLLVGEMRDLPTIAAAVSAAETGHLVFGTLHTVSVDTSVDRLINVFPAVQQDQVRAMLAESLRAVACQYLLPRRDAPGRVLALEVMLCNDAVSNLIRKGKTFQIHSVISASAELGMRTMDSELMGLFKAGRISAEDAYIKARSKSDFEAVLSQEGPSVVLPSLAPLLAAGTPPSIAEPVAQLPADAGEAPAPTPPPAPALAS